MTGKNKKSPRRMMGNDPHTNNPPFVILFLLEYQHTKSLNYEFVSLFLRLLLSSRIPRSPPTVLILLVLIL